MLDTGRNPLSSTERNRLENYLRTKVPATPKVRLSIPRRNADEVIPLAPVQEQIWVHARMAPDLPLYNEPVTIHYSGRMDPVAFERAFNEILRRHEAWRTSFSLVEGRPVQVAHPEVIVRLPVLDLCHLPESDREAEAVRIATTDAVVPLDLTRPPLFRARLIRLDNEIHRLYLTLSHIIFDGVAIYRVFLPELAALYKAFSAGLPSPLPELPFQYPDFACWQNNVDRAARRAADTAYWRTQLAGELPVLDLPSDRPRPPVQSFRGSMYPWVLGTHLLSGLKALSQAEGVTLFQTLLAAFAVLLQRYSGQDDIPIGSVTSGRDVPGTNLLLGYFLNTLVLRLDVSGDITFRELLVRARNVTLEALAHDTVPLADLINELRVRRDSSHNPLFQTMFTMEPPIPPLEAGWQLTQMEIDTGATKYDLYLELDERREGILARFHYSTDLFERKTIVRMAEQWTTLLEAVVVAPNKQLHELPILPLHQRQQILVDWNSTDEPYPNRAIHELFERQANHSPEAVAVEFDNRRLSYVELNSRANQLARHLQSLGAGPDRLIGLFIERSPEMVVALLGILKSGAAYIPLDPSYPEERLRFVLEDAKPLLIVSQESLRVRLSNHSKIVTLDGDRNEIAAHSGTDLEQTCGPQNLAYVIYTSGSTGKPKGVQVQHRCVVNFLTSMQREPGITTQDVLAAVTTLSFDIAGLEIYLPLITGARIVLVPSEVVRDGVRLKQLLRESGVTMMQATPSTWRMLLESGWQGSPQLKILCGGEPLSPTLASEIKRRCGSLWNLYGPTETTIWSLADRVNDEADSAISIGRPIANTGVYILDRHLNPVPIGVAGEVCISGEGVARGYLNRPDLTSERFISNPFVDAPKARLYKTGDLGRYRNDGRIEFLGRADTQVKIRGFRVELGEIETALAKHEFVKSAVAVVREVGNAEPRLIAYIIPAQEQTPDVEALRTYLRPLLPEYMIPSSFIFLDDLPLTPNGKVNRKALPAHDPVMTRTANLVPPRDETETRLVEIWQSVLNTNPIGVNDDFFGLGGHSILAVRLFAEIERSFGKSIPLASLLRAPTIDQLAHIIRGDAKLAKWRSLVPFQTNGTQTPLFCVHGHYGEVLFYRPLSKYLGDLQPFYALQAVATNGRPAYESIEEMASHYISEMREARPHGPYCIAGYCFGSLIAFEMAQRLLREGEEVAFLGLFMGYESHEAFIPRQVTRVRRHLDHFRKDGLKAKLADVRFNLWARLKATVWHVLYKTSRNLFAPSSRFFQNIPGMNLQAASRYSPRFYSGRMTVFLSGDIPPDFVLHPKLDLHGLNAEQIDLKIVPGNQHTMMQDPQVAMLGRALAACLKTLR